MQLVHIVFVSASHEAQNALAHNGSESATAKAINSKKNISVSLLFLWGDCSSFRDSFKLLFWCREDEKYGIYCPFSCLFSLQKRVQTISISITRTIIEFIIQKYLPKPTWWWNEWRFFKPLLLFSFNNILTNMETESNWHLYWFFIGMNYL